MSDNWHYILPESDFPEEGKLATRIGQWHVLVARTDTGFTAFNDRCPHQGALLSTGKIRRGAVMCPLHGARFDVHNGQCLGGSYPKLQMFPVRPIAGAI